MVDATHMRLGALIYDKKAICDHFGVKEEDACLPVWCSNKKGGHALSLCPCWGQPGHTSLLSAAHRKPANWDIAMVEKDFATKAPAAGSKRKMA